MHKSNIKIVANIHTNLTSYGKIVLSANKGCANFYQLLTFNPSYKNLWESAMISLDRSWEKAGTPQEITKDEFNLTVDKILHLKHFNKIKQFMIRLRRNNL